MMPALSTSPQRTNSRMRKCSIAQLQRDCSAALAAEDLAEELLVGGRRAVPGEVGSHAVTLKVRPERLVPIGQQALVDRLQQAVGPVLVELEPVARPRRAV